MDDQKKNIMVRIAALLEEHASRFAVFVLFVFVFSWPYLSFIQHTTPAKSFGYFFIVWAMLIVVLWASHASLKDIGGDNGEPKK